MKVAQVAAAMVPEVGVNFAISPRPCPWVFVVRSILRIRRHFEVFSLEPTSFGPSSCPHGKSIDQITNNRIDSENCWPHEEAGR